MTLVKRMNICSTATVVLSAWRPLPGGKLLHAAYHTVTSIGEKWYGQMGTEQIKAAVDSLMPGSPERIEAVDQHHVDTGARALAAILQAFPGLEADAAGLGATGLVRRNEIEITYLSRSDVPGDAHVSL